MTQEKDLWEQQTEPGSDLAATGVVIGTLAPKRKDGLYGKSFMVPIDNNCIAPQIADILATLARPEGYIFQVTLYDKDLGAHASTSDTKNPLEAFEKAKFNVRRSLVASAAQDEALRIEEAEIRVLDIAENAAISEKFYQAFKFQIESIDITCMPTSWYFT
jgi:hypothetical protein